MSSIIPPEALAHVYGTASETMMLRVLDGPDGPGLVLLATLRQLTEAQLAAIRKQISDEEAARKATAASLAQADAAEVTARANAITTMGARVTALEASQLRFELVRGTVATAGATVSVTFAKAFTAPPTLIDITTWSGDQMVASGAAEVTTTGAKIAVKRSRPTLVLTSGPFENAPAGTAFTMLALGR